MSERGSNPWVVLKYVQFSARLSSLVKFWGNTSLSYYFLLKVISVLEEERILVSTIHVYDCKVRNY